MQHLMGPEHPRVIQDGERYINPRPLERCSVTQYPCLALQDVFPSLVSRSDYFLLYNQTIERPIPCIMSSSVAIQNYVMYISHSTWRLGCTIECDRVAEPDDTCAAAWKDGESWYVLLSTTSGQLSDSTPAHLDEVCMIHERGTLSAAWSNAYPRSAEWFKE